MLVLQQERVANPIEWMLPLLSMIPLAIGLLEDVTKNLGAKTRLALITISALLTVLYLNLHISTVSIWGLDALLLIPAVSTATAVFAIVGLTNAYNIIDGVNGLASMIGVLASLSLGYVGYLLGDPALIQLSFSLVAALLGFFILNYPRGLIFLGDGGAYLIGFWIAALSIWTCVNDREVSPWFALLISAYPIIETIFTIFRRLLYKKTNVLAPDRLHLHSLIYRRTFYTQTPQNEAEFILGNAKTAPYLWVLNGITLVPAVLWWDKTSVLMAFFALYLVCYLWLYQRFVRFNKPKWFSFFN